MQKTRNWQATTLLVLLALAGCQMGPVDLGDPVEPSDLSGLSATALDSSIMFSWDAAPTADFSEIVVDCKTTSTSRSVEPEKTELTWEGLENGRLYEFEIRTKNLAGGLSKGFRVMAKPRSAASPTIMVVTLVDNSGNRLSKSFDLTVGGPLIFDASASSKTTVSFSYPPGSSSRTLELPRGAQYVLAFASKAVPPRSLGRALATEAIVPEGTVSLSSSSLSTLPLGATANGNIDLGDLAQPTGTTVTSLETGLHQDPATTFDSVAPVGSSLGIASSDLSVYSNFDANLVKFANPDINQDGVYDWEQNNPFTGEVFTWDFRTTYQFTNANFDIDTGSALVEPSKVWSMLGSIYFDMPKMVQNFTVGLSVTVIPPSDKHYKVEKSDIVVTQFTGQVDGTSSNVAVAGVMADGSTLDLDGNYEIRLGTSAGGADLGHYWLKNVRFLNLLKSKEGVPIASVRTVTNSGGWVTGVDFKWRVIKGDTYAKVTSEGLKLVLSDTIYPGGYPAGAGTLSIGRWPMGTMVTLDDLLSGHVTFASPIDPDDPASNFPADMKNTVTLSVRDKAGNILSYHGDTQ